MSLLAILQDRSFTFILKTPPASVLLAKAAGVPKGSGTPNSLKVGKITQAQLKVSLDSRDSEHTPVQHIYVHLLAYKLCIMSALP